MDRVNGHTLWRRTRRLRQAFAKHPVPVVADADPIHAAQHNRLLVAQKHEPRQLKGSTASFIGS